MAPKSQRWRLTEDSVEREIDADADVLYVMVSDMPRMGEWSPECASVTWDGDVAEPVEGTTFVGHNKSGPGGRIKWSRHGTVLRAEPGKAFSFITDEGGRPSTACSARASEGVRRRPCRGGKESARACSVCGPRALPMRSAPSRDRARAPAPRLRPR